MKTVLKGIVYVILLYALAAFLAYKVAHADCVGVSTLGVKKNGTMFSTFLNFPESYGYRFCFMYWEDASTVCLSMTDQPELHNGKRIGTVIAQHEVDTDQLSICIGEES